jgi:hypothetical protein
MELTPEFPPQAGLPGKENQLENNDRGRTAEIPPDGVRDDGIDRSFDFLPCL